MRAPKDTLLRRSLRAFTLGSGPLKRRSDRVQLIGRLVVLLSFLLAPPLAVAAANAETAHLQEVATAEAAERSPTRAVLLENAPPPAQSSSDYADAPTLTVSARAEWRLPGGATREGPVTVAPGTAGGTAVPVWVDQQGNLTRAPLDQAAIPTSAAVMGTLPLLGVPLAAWTLYCLLCRALDAHRGRRWAQDWATVEPEWNSRLQ